MKRPPQKARLAMLAVALALAAAPAAAAADALVQDATLDTTFDADGRKVVPIDLRPGHDVAERAVADGQGGVWIVGRAAIAGANDGQRYVLAAVRLERDGSVGAFAVRQEIEFWRDTEGPAYELQSIAADREGRLLLSALVCTAPFQDACTSRLLRVARDGSPDSTFDGDGELRVAVTQTTYGAVTAGPGGQVWASGSVAGAGSRLFRFDDQGALLASVAADRAYAGFAEIADGRWLALANMSGGAAQVVRLSAEGVPDRGFGLDGRATVPEALGDCGLDAPAYRAAALSATPDGRAAVLVHLSELNTPQLSLVAGIGAGGEVGSPVCVAHLNPQNVDLAASAPGVALREDGRAFVALTEVGKAQGPGLGMAAYRLSSDASLAVDMDFNGGLPFAVSFPNAAGVSDAFAAAVVLDRGAPILVGSARVDGAGYDFAAARMLGSSRVFRGGFE